MPCFMKREGGRERDRDMGGSQGGKGGRESKMGEKLLSHCLARPPSPFILGFLNNIFFLVLFYAKCHYGRGILFLSCPEKPGII